MRARRKAGRNTSVKNFEKERSKFLRDSLEQEARRLLSLLKNRKDNEPKTIVDLLVQQSKVRKLIEHIENPNDPPLRAFNRGVLHKATEVMGSRNDAIEWLHQPAIGLGVAPASLIESVDGREIVMNYLNRISMGVYC